jgi:transcriptional regulator of acetoin/glycerol metabolism
MSEIKAANAQTRNAKAHVQLIAGVNREGGVEEFATVTGGRLGWRVNEWVKLTGISRPTVWRQIRDGRLNVVDVGGITIVPRAEAVRLGLIAA